MDLRCGLRAACVLAAGVVLAACGAGYTKRDFVARADAICASALRDARAIQPEPASATQSGQPAVTYVTRLLSVVQREVGQLRSLPRPAQDARSQAALKRWLAALGTDLASYRSLTAAARRGDPGGVAAAEAALRSSPSTAFAASYGVGACAAPGGTVP